MGEYIKTNFTQSEFIVYGILRFNKCLFSSILRCIYEEKEI